MGQLFYGHNHLLKVRLSMSRLLTVVNERKRIRDEYRRHLEYEYINMKKQEEKEERLAKMAAAAEADALNAEDEEELEENDVEQDGSEHEEDAAVKLTKKDIPSIEQ